MNSPQIVNIIKTKSETQTIKTITFNYPSKIEPGQFFMIWIPGIDEIPMSVSVIDKNIRGITFKQVGEATKALFNLKPGDKIGVRGPYGNGFKIKGKRILFIGGGTGIAMIAPAVEKAISKNITSDVILGVKSKDDLFFEKRLKEIGAKIHISTDDGSQGYDGLATDLALALLVTGEFTSVLTCGPEIMMKKILEISDNTPIQASLERYMKCGIGICGQCCTGKGLRVCTDGPVFDSKTLKKVENFGVYKRDAAGRKINF